MKKDVSRKGAKAQSDAQITQIHADEKMAAQQLLMVGFNRRFSPHVVKIKHLLQSRGEPLAMSFMVNAGIIPKNVWVHDPEVGGGRIIGEACHFIDLLSYICGSRIVSVASAQMGRGVRNGGRPSISK